MPGLSHTLDIARRAMSAQQSVMAVVGHNVANANTEGYTRQVARLVSETPSAWDQSIFGNGVAVDSVDRKRNAVLDQELRQDLSELGRWTTRSERLLTLEDIINEPSDAGLGAALDEFWNAWSEFAGDPDDQTRRAVVREQGRVLGYRLQTMRDRTEQLGRAIDAEIAVRVDEFNLTLSDLSSLSTLIKESQLQGNPGNDLRDRRDLLLDQLMQLAPITYGERTEGTQYLRLDHTLILDEGLHRPLQVEINADGAGHVSVVLENGVTPEITSGELGGLIELREETLPEFLGQLDTLAADLIQAVNGLHRAGPSGTDFFAGSGLADFELAPEIEKDLNLINASTSGLPGDNDLALAISELRSARIMTSGTISLRDYWNNAVGRVGVSSREAQFQQESFTLTSASLQERRASEAGVSLDEELTNMLASQQAYIAAVKIFQTAEDMMDALMSI